MQLFEIETSNGVNFRRVIEPVPFRDIRVGEARGREADIVDLVERYPQLLNSRECRIGCQEESELLIVAKEPQTQTRKRPDLVAIHRQGDLIVIEAKRDAQDERARPEAVEFQAIRYAAACTRVDAKQVIEWFAEYLKKKCPEEHSDGGHYIEKAKKQLGLHLELEFGSDRFDEELSEKLNPEERDERVFLVAAEFDLDVISACAWLRQHQIDISCFRLRPYQIGGTTVLERDRVIPPPELGDYMVGMAGGPGVVIPPNRGKAGRKGPSPASIAWESDPQKELDANESWRFILRHVIGKALDGGMDPAQLPMSSTEDKTEGEAYHAPYFVERKHLWVETNGDADRTKTWISEILSRRPSLGGLSVTTSDGSVERFPREK